MSNMRITWTNAPARVRIVHCSKSEILLRDRPSKTEYSFKVKPNTGQTVNDSLVSDYNHPDAAPVVT